MRLERITGPATILQCGGCLKEGVGGSEPFLSASRNVMREPEEWYHVLGSAIAWCSTCAAKIAHKDEAASVNVFYTDTAGKSVVISQVIAPKIFPGLE